MKVKGRCPMCGRETLQVEGDGRVHCVNADCSRPLAAHEVLNLDMSHRVRFSDSGFSVEHTLAERLLGVMLECDLHEYLAVMDYPPVPPGRYYARKEFGTWYFEKIPEQ
jgi:hypothetical protein